MSDFKLPKWAVVIAAALLFLPLAVDWVPPGEGTRLAAGWLESACRGGRDGTEEESASRGRETVLSRPPRQALENGERDVWAIFKTIVDSVEPENYAAYLNLLGMVQRGFAASKDEVADLTKRRQQIEKGLKSWEQVRSAVRAGGRLYSDPEDVAKYEKAKRPKSKVDMSSRVERTWL